MHYINNNYKFIVIIRSVLVNKLTTFGLNFDPVLLDILHFLAFTLLFGLDLSTSLLEEEQHAEQVDPKTDRAHDQQGLGAFYLLGLHQSLDGVGEN